MNSLRFLLVNTDARKTESISTVLASANHTVLPTTGLEEASEALYIERFDAILLGSRFSAPSLGEFTSKLRRVEESQRGAGRIPVLAIDGQPQEGAPCDGYLNEPLDPSALTEAVTRLAQALSEPGQI
jgi:CheY-like chemotaxis protein